MSTFHSLRVKHFVHISTFGKLRLMLICITHNRCAPLSDSLRLPEVATQEQGLWFVDCGITSGDHQMRCMKQLLTRPLQFVLNIAPQVGAMHSVQSCMSFCSFFFLIPSVRKLQNITSAWEKLLAYWTRSFCAWFISSAVTAFPYICEEEHEEEGEQKKHRDWLEKRAPDKWLKRLWSNSVQKMSF